MGACPTKGRWTVLPMILLVSLAFAQTVSAQGSFSWLQTSTTSQAPPARMGHGMVYDALRQKVIVFGGKDAYGNFLNDMWQWDPATQSWSPVIPTTAAAPLPRANFAMAYDLNRSKIVLYGGNVSTAYSNVGVIGDTWEFDSATLSWTQIPADTLVSVGLWGAQATYDPNLRQVILFGGQPYWVFPGNSTTYAWTGSAWVAVASTTYPAIEWVGYYIQTSPWGPGPAGRVSPMMVTDTIRSRVVLFGGHTISPTSSYDVWQNDTWEWDGSTWTQVALNGTAPSARQGGGFAYELLGSSVLFGGYSPAGVLGDTWQWNGTTWTNLASHSNPPARSTAMTFISAINSFVIFGGTNGPGADTWFGSLIANDDDSQLANLAGGNAFTGNQTIAGTVTATKGFVGDGSGLTNVVLSFNGRTGAVGSAANDYSFAQIAGTFGPAQAGPGTYPISISGNAATATVASSAGNAATLNGLTQSSTAAANTIASRDGVGNLAANTFNGTNANINGNALVSGITTTGRVVANASVAIGGGTPILGHLSLPNQLMTFSGTITGTKACLLSQGIQAPGAADGDTVTLTPSAATMPGSPPFLHYTGWVSAAGIITVRACSADPSVTILTNLKSWPIGVFRIDIWKH